MRFRLQNTSLLLLLLLLLLLSVYRLLSGPWTYGYVFFSYVRLIGYRFHLFRSSASRPMIIGIRKLSELTLNPVL